MYTSNIQQPDEQVGAPVVMDIRHISTEQLAQLGLQQIAYVKPSVRAVRIPIEELERILAVGLRPAIPQAEGAR